MPVDKFLPVILPERSNEYRQKIGNELAKGHSASDTRAEADLQSLTLLEKFDQAPIILLKSSLFKGSSRALLLSLQKASINVLTALETCLPLLGFPKDFIST